MANVVQSDYRNPTVDPGVTVRTALVHPLQLGPVPAPSYIENLTNKEDPQHTIRSGKSGH